MIFYHRSILLLLAIVLLGSACGINPVTGKREINFINERGKSR
jgi:hypothetical protein